ncbi:hypothetical protein L1887_48403 [Cichorium endivia]|nr:hypothetical protein L1887_48403 [Cichorium endivia]
MEATFCHLKLAPLKQRRKSSRVRQAEFLGSPKSDFREQRHTRCKSGRRSDSIRGGRRNFAQFEVVIGTRSSVGKKERIGGWDGSAVKAVTESSAHSVRVELGAKAGVRVGRRLPLCAAAAFALGQKGRLVPVRASL